MAIQDENKLKALDAALSQIEKQFGKGAVMKLGDQSAHMNVETVPTGSLSLDIDRVLAVAQNADVWLIKSFNIHSLQDLQQANPLHAEFRAFKTENVYVCDTNSTRLYELFPFHPDILLREYIDIFDGNDKATRFFKKVSQ